MQKVAVIGAGSVSFTKKLVNDLLFDEAFQDAEFRLMDIDPDRLDFADNTMRLVNERRGANATFLPTTDRIKALDGADFVITVLQVGVTPRRRSISRCAGNTASSWSLATPWACPASPAPCARFPSC